VPDIVGITLVATGLLSIERAAYAWIARRPRAFRALAGDVSGVFAADPVAGVRALFVAFKVLQAGVFAGWCYAFGGALLPQHVEPAILAAGGALVGVGQLLNVAVFGRLGMRGVFYATQFGDRVSWVKGFPFCWFRHPQYVGTVLTIWGLFLIARFPSPDWPVLPAVETVLYTIGAHVEQDR
jgi:methylene-fatty-acyl-phospholipid synthase